MVGARVAVHYGSNDTAAAEVVVTIRQAGGQAFSVRAELGLDGDVDTLFAEFDRQLGRREPLDILINNAGISDYAARAPGAYMDKDDLFSNDTYGCTPRVALIREEGSPGRSLGNHAL